MAALAQAGGGTYAAAEAPKGAQLFDNLEDSPFMRKQARARRAPGRGGTPCCTDRRLRHAPRLPRAVPQLTSLEEGVSDLRERSAKLTKARRAAVVGQHVWLLQPNV